MQGGFSDLKQRDWLRACKKLGLIVDCTRGSGSHCLIKHPKTNAKYTIQYKLYKVINMRIFKKMMDWGFRETEIWEALK